VSEFETIFEANGLLVACLAMFIKSIGVPLPVPGDLIVLAAAAQVGQGKLDLLQTFGALLIAVVAGGVAQFAIARGPGHDLVYRLARFAGLSRDRLDRIASAILQRGPLSVAVTLLTPGVRNAALPACGLAGMPARTFVPALVAATGLDLALHFAIGAFGGSVLEVLHPDPAMVIFGLVVLAGLGLAGWLILARRRAPDTRGSEVLATWEATACPVCVALGALGGARSSYQELPAHVEL
jgi:membrane protein DedA with SNARE-associated domain